jgi:hypothetical protein
MVSKGAVMQNENNMKNQNTFINIIAAVILMVLPAIVLAEDEYVLVTATGCRLIVKAGSDGVERKARILGTLTEDKCSNANANGGYVFIIEFKDKTLPSFFSSPTVSYFEAGYPVAYELWLFGNSQDKFINVFIQYNDENLSSKANRFKIPQRILVKSDTQVMPLSEIIDEINKASNASNAPNELTDFMIKTVSKWYQNFNTFNYLRNKSIKTNFVSKTSGQNSNVTLKNSTPAADDPKVVGGGSKGVYN